MEYPDKPGVYLMKNKEEILYVGKAKSLKHRLSSYFQKNMDSKTEEIMKNTTDLDFFVCESEVDALVLEANLIKEHTPRFNIRLKDSTSYPYLKLTTEEYPRLLVTRDVRDGKVFGPYGSAKALRSTTKFMRRLFPLRSCTVMKKRECLDFHLGLCPAPCTGRVTKEEYSTNVKRLSRFLEGKVDELIDELTKEMQEASDAANYEKAALIRDRIFALERIRVKQGVQHPFLGDVDVLAVTGGKKKCFTVLLVRGGKIVGKHQYVLETEVEEFFARFYVDRLVPDEVCVQRDVGEVVRGFLQRKREDQGKSQVKVTVPKRGKKKKLLEMAERDAEIHLTYVYGELELLRDELGLKQTPERIEGYDVSNIMGEEATASGVCFINGKPFKKHYRHYRIRRKGIDDYAMVEEVLSRRFTHTDVLPDLLLIDGGKGHLSTALKVVKRMGLDIPVVALAKKEEEVFSEGLGEVSEMSRRLLIRVRDEAHRFAVEYHRLLRQKQLKKSILDEVEGVGEKRKKVLMLHFGSVEAVKGSSLEELEAVLKNRRVAERVYRALHEE